MVLKIILAIALAGFFVFEVYNLVQTVIKRKRAKSQVDQPVEQVPLDDKQKSDKGVNE